VFSAAEAMRVSSVANGKETNMQAIRIGFSRLLLVLVGLVCSCLAHAAYQITSIDYPNVGFTEVFGINDNGVVVGFSNVAFTYDARTGVFTPVPDAPGGVFGINDHGVMVGPTGFPEDGFVRRRDGTYTVFSKPGWDNTEPRAVSETGLVTGYAFNSGFPTTTVGFIYDPAHDTFIDILSGPFTIAQGINVRGEVVGSATLPAGVACTGCLAGIYGWLRAPSGSLTFFQVNGHSTRARGITDSGLIAGFMTDPVSGHQKGFVVELARTSSYQSLTVPDAELLEVPSAVITAPPAISNSGVIVGNWLDAFGFHGFIAMPLPNGK
jgi:hypothetical protein